MAGHELEIVLLAVLAGTTALVVLSRFTEVPYPILLVLGGVGLSVAAAFVLGAVVSPTDPLAATTIARRLGAPRRVVTIVEGESLVNDGTALVIYGVAVTAAV